jgi:hypothetical protein
VPEAEDAQVEQADGDFGGEEGEHVPEDAVPAGLGGWGVSGWGWVRRWGGDNPYHGNHHGGVDVEEVFS